MAYYAAFGENPYELIDLTEFIETMRKFGALRFFGAL